LVRFNQIVDFVLTHREHNTQPTTHHPQHTTSRMTVPHFQWFYTIKNLSFSHSCFSRPLDWAISPNVPSIPRPGGMRASALNKLIPARPRLK
jgi:hypothetical protein